MKAKIKIKAVEYNGGNSVFTINVECPDFKVVKNRDIKGYPLPDLTIEEQIDKWYLDVDKKELMEERDLSAILDWEVVKNEQKKVKVTLAELIDEHVTDEEIKIDLAVTYKKMEKSLKRLSNERKLKILFDSLGLSYQSKIRAFEEVDEIREKVKSDFKEKKKQRGHLSDGKQELLEEQKNHSNQDI